MPPTSFPRNSVCVAPVRPGKGRQRAFTLVEVTLAIGIISFAFVAIFALLPVGMTQFRRSMDNSLISEIAARIINDVKQSDFDTLAALGKSGAAGSVRYFDESGTDLTPSDGSKPSKQWLYYGTISVTQASTLIPSPISKSYSSDNLLTVDINLGADPGHRDNPFDAQYPNGNRDGSKLPYRAFSTLVARNQTHTK